MNVDKSNTLYCDVVIKLYFINKLILGDSVLYPFILDLILFIGVRVTF